MLFQAFSFFGPWGTIPLSHSTTQDEIKVIPLVIRPHKVGDTPQNVGPFLGYLLNVNVNVNARIGRPSWEGVPPSDVQRS